MIPKLDSLTPTQRAVREQFQEGGNIGTLAWVMLVLALVIVIAYFATRPKDRTLDGTLRPCPQRFFRTLLSRLGLTAPQRRVLNSVAADLRLTNPAAMLLAPALFDRYTKQWRSRLDGRDVPKSDTSNNTAIEELRRCLFTN